MARRPNRDQIENTLGWTSLLRGDLVSDGALQINGWVEGSVTSKAAVVVGASGAVRGHVIGVDVIVAGKVFGNVSCAGHLEILATGRIEGDIEAQSVRVETGGVFRGASRMGIQSHEAVPQIAALPDDDVDDGAAPEPSGATDAAPEIASAPHDLLTTAA